MDNLKRLKIPPILKTESFITVVLIAFVMVGIKKYEPGGNPDTIWYAAIARNIAQSGNFFHFYISKYYLNPIYDHMPLTYWVTAVMFKGLGVSDFVSRIYPMVCSFLTYLVVFLLGKIFGKSHQGLSAVVNLALCFEFTKWNGSLMHDVPLSFYVISACYFLIKGKSEVFYFYLASFCFALGVWTKGPIIFCIPAGLFLYSLIHRDSQFIRSRHFYFSILLTLFLLSILFWKPFLFNNRNYYSIFFESKIGYLNGNHGPMGGGFTYLIQFLGKATVPVILLILSWSFKSQPPEQKFLFYVLLLLVIPMSLASVKFPHYMVPAYPLLAVLSSSYLSDWFKKNEPSVTSALRVLSVIVLIVMVSFPIKVTGKRTKEVLNLVNMMKFDHNIKDKKTYFFGNWNTDMSIFQMFKFYGNIDVIPLDNDKEYCLNSAKSQLIIPLTKLPTLLCNTMIKTEDCLVLNQKYCLVSGRSSTQFELPTLEFPHEVY